MEKQFLGVQTVIYFVPDLEEAKSWYVNVFQIKPYFDESFYIGFKIHGYELGLHPREKNLTSGQNVIAYWGVQDVEAEYKKMLAAGAIEHEPPTNVGGEIVVASVVDPWGNGIGLIYNPGFDRNG